MSQVTIKARTLEGKSHFVIPTVMITEGVHCGSNGPIYYSANALRTSAPFWNGKPIVVYHPALFSKSSAADPEVFNQQKIGTIFNTRFDGKKLHAEAWIDEERVRNVDIRVFKSIVNREMVEVSTGLFSDGNVDRGTWNGKSYSSVALNIRPDHLAILPDMEGACSIADGAGLIRNRLGHDEEFVPLPAMTF